MPSGGELQQILHRCFDQIQLRIGFECNFIHMPKAIDAGNDLRDQFESLFARRALTRCVIWSIFSSSLKSMLLQNIGTSVEDTAGGSTR